MTSSAMQTKVCNSCRTVLSVSEFHAESKSRDGFRASCKSCRKQHTDNYNAKNRDRINARQREYNKRPSVNDRHKDWCREYYQENKDSIDQSKKKWTDKNRDRVREAAKRSQKRALQDPVKAEKHRMRARLSMAVSSKGFKGKPKTESMLGCTWVEFLAHIESLFCEGMSWENRNLWHIDHIVPLDSADSIQRLAELCHYTNLQPLWARDNLSKGAKIDNHCKDSAST